MNPTLNPQLETLNPKTQLSHAWKDAKRIDAQGMVRRPQLVCAGRQVEARAPGVGFRVQGCRVQGLGVQGLGVYDVGLRGAGFRGVRFWV